MICIFAPRTSPRLEYVLQHLCKVLWGKEYRLFFEKEAFLRQEAEARINYSEESVETAYHIRPHTLLYETDIRKQDIVWEECEGTPCCFRTRKYEEEAEWDFFASTFYFLSRYEEYLSHPTDAHGRFRAENSAAFSCGGLQKALVDRWAAMLSAALHRKFPTFEPAKSRAVFQPTYDIDIAYAYSHKAYWLQAGGLLRSLLHRQMSEFKERMAVSRGQKDPYDTFDYLETIHRENALHPLYFLIFAKHGRYDKGNPPQNRAYRALACRLAEQGSVGIHASYASSFSNRKRLLREIEALESAIGRKICANRAHYLRIRLPETYRAYLSSGLTEDYSMGYAETAGFRAGSCSPFFFFDLERNEATSLRVHPLLLMENAFFHVEERSEEALWQQIRPLLDEVLRFGGEVVTLFHNPSFGCRPGHNLPVKELYAHIIQYLKSCL